jgi:multiple sugar transport system substrate-binding protein
MATLKGLTWDHPRGYNALAAAAAQAAASGFDIHWDKQPLEGFESHPIEDLCSRYDLVVLDHPHIGEAVRAGCLQSLESVFGVDYVGQLGRNAIGPSLRSYRFAGEHWALPLDAASQVMARRADLVGSAPSTWSDVLTLSQKEGRVALSLAGPHAILNFLSACAALGYAPAERDPEELVPDAVGEEAFELLRELASRSPTSVRDKNPIDILAHMATNDDVALCPLVYGYVNYAAPAAGKCLAFSDAPRSHDGGRPGSTLGGTGIGLTRRCVRSPALLSHLQSLMSEDTQIRFIPAHDGQPSSRAAWLDEGVNQRWGGFYRDTFETLEQAYVRPRHDGYMAFQAAAAALLRAAFDERREATPVLRELQKLYSQNRQAGSER